MKTFSLVVAVLSVLGPTSVFASSIVSELNADQIKIVENGGQVVLTTNVSGSAWPKVFIYQFIDATPEESQAVFIDYPLATTYQPGLIKSEIVKHVDKTTDDVRMQVKASFVTETTTMEYHFEATPGGYAANWKMLSATTTKEGEGTSRFEPFEKGTLVAYYSFIKPGIPFAGMFRPQAVKQVGTIAESFSRQIEKERKSNPALLNEQIAKLRAALAP